MTQPMEIPLYGKVKKREMFKEELLDLWNEIICRTGLSVNTMEKVEAIRGERGDFKVETGNRTYSAKRILLAIGRRGTPRKLGVAGEKSSKVAYRLIEPEQYHGSNVLVIGGGDSAIEAAVAISEVDRTHVTLSYRGDALTRVKDANRQRFESAVADGRIRDLFKSRVLEIREREAVLESGEDSMTLDNDYVLIFIGGVLPTDFLEKTGIRVQTKYGEA